MASIVRGRGSTGDSGMIEKKFKLSLQNMERRFVDLEVAISEIVSRLNALSEMKGDVGTDSAAVEELMQRVDQLEDLIAVEQAGITELKDIMTSIDKGFEHRFDTLSIEEKIKEVENIVHIITKRLERYAEEPTKMGKQMVDRIEKLEAEIGGMKRDVESAMEQVMAQAGEKKRKEGAEGDDFEQVAHMEIGQLKQNLRNLDKKFGERIEVLKKEMQERPADRAAPAPHPKQLEGLLRKYEDEMKRYKTEVENTRVRIDSLSQSMSKLTSHLDKIQKRGKAPAGNFASADSMADVNKELDDMNKYLDRLTKEHESLRDELKNSVNRKDLQNMMKSMSGERPDLSKLFGGMKDEMNEAAKKIESNVEKRVSDRINDLNKRFGDLNRKLDESRDRQKKLEERIGKMGSVPDAGKYVKKMEQQIDILRSEVDSVRKVLIKMDERYSKKSKEADKHPRHDPQKEMRAFIKGFGKRMGHLEKNLNRVRDTVSDLTKEVEQEAVSAQDGYFRQITDKLVFLESRLAAVESLLHRPQPIVLE